VVISSSLLTSYRDFTVDLRPGDLSALVWFRQLSFIRSNSDCPVCQTCCPVFIKAIQGIAVLVFTVANPIGDNSGIAFTASIIVLVACGVAWAMLEVFGGYEEEPKRHVTNGQVAKGLELTLF
jgi:hypothetical protein